MSQPTERERKEIAVEQAIREWVASADDGDDVMTGYVLITCAAMISNDNATSYMFSAVLGQPTHVTRGLVEHLRDWARERARFDE